MEGSKTKALAVEGISRIAPGEGEEPSRQRLLWQRILGNKMLIVGAIVVLVFTFMGIFAPYLTPYDPEKPDFNTRYAKPSVKHLMGTDNFGRDTFVRILYGTRVSFKVGIIAVMIGMGGGMLIGAAGGYIGGFIDEVSMRMMDALLAFPPFLLAIGLVASVGPSLMTVSVVIGFIYIPRFARVMRSAVLVEREKEYVEAARALGVSGITILAKHIGPTTISPVVVLSTIIFAQAIILEAALSFLGVGVPPPTPSWGTMLNEARSYLKISIWMAIWPGLTMTIAVLGFNLLGDGLRDFLDPKFYTANGKTTT